MSPPPNVRLGPLTRTIADEARWLVEDEFPAHQPWADDVERVLAHLESSGQFHRFLPRLRASAKQRNEALAEARVSFFLHRNGFKILEFEPVGANGKVGELLVQWGETTPVFVEVKAPSWRAELFPDGPPTPEQLQIIKERLQKPKHINGEARAINPASEAFDVIGRNALEKLTDRRPNLVVIVDDYFVSAVGIPNLQAVAEREMSAEEMSADYVRLGGVLFLNPECFLGRDEIEYRIDYVHNPRALSACQIPEPVRLGFQGGALECDRHRKQRLGEHSPLFSLFHRASVQ